MGVRFDRRVNPVTVEASSFFLETAENPRTRIRGSVTVSPDLRSAAFTPEDLLPAETRLQIRIMTAVQDLAGNRLSSSQALSAFTTGTETDEEAPTVLLVSPANGASEVAVNTRIVLHFSEPIAAGIPVDAIVLSDGTSPVAGSATAISGTDLLFQPTEALSPATTYAVAVAGVTDRAGNPAPAFNSTFTTSTDATVDTTRPRVATVVPTNGAAGVAVDTQITLVFDEVIDVTTVSPASMPVTLDGVSGVLPGSYQVAESAGVSEVIFTPASPLPGETRIRVRISSNGVVDLAGNPSILFSASFTTTGAAPDDIPPALVAVTPSNGAVDVGPSPLLTLTFDEPLLESTITPQTFALFANGDTLTVDLRRSLDNRTVTLAPRSPLPPSVVMTMVATDDITDIAGNSLADLSSSFTTATALDLRRPRVVSTRPANGANGVPRDRSVVLFVDELLDPDTTEGALVVIQDGVEVTGIVAVTGNGAVLQFTPDAPFDAGTQVKYFLSSQMRDRAGNELLAFDGSFRPAADPADARPTLVRFSPTSSGGPLNLAVDAEMSEPLDPASVDATSVILRRLGDGDPVVPAILSLTRGGRVIRIEPETPLLPETQYSWELTTTLRDLDGDTLSSAVIRAFRTGTAPDEEPPSVVAISPPEGTTGIGLNGVLRLRFNEAVNSLTIHEESVILSDPEGILVPCNVNL